jgi:hypothetical protein
MSITQDDLTEWKTHPVTMAVFGQAQAMVAEEAIQLVMNGPTMAPQAIKDRSIEIATVSGFVRDLMEVELDDLQ